tara:strand:+ start:1265 stop:1438 length:174 start_codon:yes stop_codon:yes gene_type:complete
VEPFQSTLLALPIVLLTTSLSLEEVVEELILVEVVQVAIALVGTQKHLVEVGLARQG